MKRIVKLTISLILVLSMIGGAVSANAIQITTMAKWEILYEFEYNYGNDIYIVNIYQKENFDRIGLTDKYNCTSQYKFVACNNKGLNEGIEYITDEYNWEISFADYTRYKNPCTAEDKTFRSNLAYEIVMKAIKKDTYLAISFNKEMPEIRQELNDAGIYYLCLDCQDSCDIKTVCRFCKGTLAQTSGVKKTTCLDCKKSNSLSLAKTVCTTCKGTNFEKVSALWQICGYYSFEDTYKDFCSNTSAFHAATTLLTNSWNTSLNEEIVAGRKLKTKWEDAIKSYNNTIKKKNNSENQKIINKAVEKNIQITSEIYSSNKTQKLIEKYYNKAVAMCYESIESAIGGALGDTSNTIVKDIFGDILNYIVEDAIGVENVDNDKELDKYIESKIDKYLYLITKKVNEYEEAPDDMTDKLKEYSNNAINSLPKGVYFTSALETTENATSSIKKCLEMVGSCFEIADDFTNYYKEYNAILNGQNAQKNSIRDLCDDIILAATIKKAQS